MTWWQLLLLGAYIVVGLFVGTMWLCMETGFDAPRSANWKQLLRTFLIVPLWLPLLAVVFLGSCVAMWLDWLRGRY